MHLDMRSAGVVTISASLFITASCFPYIHLGRRQLFDDENAKLLATSTGSTSQNGYSLTENAPPPYATLSSLLLGDKPSVPYLTGTLGLPSGVTLPGPATTAATGTGGTGIGGSPSSTGVLYPYPNITSAFLPGSTGGLSNAPSGLPTLSFTSFTKPFLGHGPVSLPSGFPKEGPATHTVIERPNGEVGYSVTGASEHGPSPAQSDISSSIDVNNLIGLPHETGPASESVNNPFPTTIELSPSGISEIARESAPTSYYPGGPIQSGTTGVPGNGCLPVVTITQASIITITVTASSSAPIDGAPFTSAPYPIFGNGTLGGFPTTGGLGTGSGVSPSNTARR